MTPADFRRFVEDIASARRLRPRRRSCSAAIISDQIRGSIFRPMRRWQRAEAMVAAYVEAGFTKIHLDTSMGCARRARGARRRRRRRARRAPRGGRRSGRATRAVGAARLRHRHRGPDARRRDACLGRRSRSRRPRRRWQRSLRTARPLPRAGIGDAFERVIALVVQPGVEFDHERVVAYEPARAKALDGVLERERSIVFEAHSTDYQPPELLQALVATASRS